MKVGILYPGSKAHPLIATDFMEGVKKNLQQQGLTDEIQLIKESIGLGGDEKEVYSKAEKLLLIEDADLLVAYIDLRVLSLLEPLIFASGKLLIVVNAGANYPQNWVPQPNIIYLTLQQAFMCWLTGKLAAAGNTSQAAVASSFYDCGYQHIAAISKSFIKNGGNIRYNYINNNLYNDSFEISGLTGFLTNEKEAKKILCVFDSLPASLFYNRVNSYQDTDNLQLYVSPMMLEPAVIPEMENNRHYSITGYSSWARTETNDISGDFAKAFPEKIKKTVSIFALQGWETGLLLQQIFIHCRDFITDGSEIAEQLAAAALQSPRGTLKLDKETNFFVGPAYRFFFDNKEKQPQMQKEPDIADDWKHFINERVEGLTSGWLNTYLCY